MKLLARFAICGVLAACGGSQDTMIAVAPPPQAEEWPPSVPSAPDAATVKTVLSSVDGAQVRVRAYLVAVTLPCPACNTSLGARRSSPHEDAIGRARPPPPSRGPGCEPCPTPAATFSDEAPKASAGSESPPLRAVGAAEALQARHVGHLFLLTGTFHATGPMGPELEVTDVRAIDAR